MAQCGKCQSRWSGNATCHCGGCHRTFTSLSAFDAHQNSDGCQDPAVMHRRKSGKPVFRWNVNRQMWALWSEGEHFAVAAEG